ncbi:teneurin, partial [Acrasis kona]
MLRPRHVIVASLVLLLLQFLRVTECQLAGDPYKTDISIAGYWLFNSTLNDIGPYKNHFSGLNQGSIKTDSVQLSSTSGQMSSLNTVTTSSQLSVSLWFQINSVTDSDTVVEMQVGSDTKGNMIRLRYRYIRGYLRNYLSLMIGDTRSNYYDYGDNSGINHLVFNVQVSGKSMSQQLFYNGVSAMSDTNKNFALGGSTNLVFPYTQITDNTKVSISKMVVATRSFTSFEINALYKPQLFCFATSASNLINCGNGYCESYDYCRCNSGWFGNQCDITFCGGIRNNNGAVCSAHGTCSGPDQCVCVDGYNGDNCEMDYTRSYNFNLTDPTNIYFYQSVVLNVSSSFSIPAKYLKYVSVQLNPIAPLAANVAYVNDNLFQLSMNVASNAAKYSFIVLYNNKNVTSTPLTFYVMSMSTNIAFDPLSVNQDYILTSSANTALSIVPDVTLVPYDLINNVRVGIGSTLYNTTFTVTSFLVTLNQMSSVGNVSLYLYLSVSVNVIAFDAISYASGTVGGGISNTTFSSDI